MATKFKSDIYFKKVLVVTEIRGCSRCGKKHKELEFKEFKTPAGIYTHWTMCPTLNEPILLEFVNKK